MRIIEIPSGLKGKELTSFLLENKSALIAQKKAQIKYTDPVSSSPHYFVSKEGQLVKAEPNEIPADANSVHVKVVANTHMWLDSHMDLLIDDCAKKSLKERAGMFVHLYDHKYTIDSQAGDVTAVYYKRLPLKDLGLDRDGTAQCIIMESDVRKDYHEKNFIRYRDGKIKQHSIGLYYVKLELAINDKNSEKEYNFWKKYVDLIINKELAEEKGYFWVVSEIKLVENSAVLFGANILTPTLQIGGKADEPEDEATEKEEPEQQPTPPQPAKNKSRFRSIGKKI